MTFHNDVNVSPDLATILVDGKLVHPQSLVTTMRGFLKPTPRGPETETGDLEIELRVHSIYGTLAAGLQRMLRSMVAPTRRARGYSICCEVHRERVGLVRLAVLVGLGSASPTGWARWVACARWFGYAKKAWFCSLVDFLRRCIVVHRRLAVRSANGQSWRLWLWQWWRLGGGGPPRTHWKPAPP